MKPNDKYVKTVSSLGHISIPVEVRRQMGLHPKTKVILLVKEDRIEIYPMENADEKGTRHGGS